MYFYVKRVWPVAFIIMTVLAHTGVSDKGQEVCRSRMIWKNFIRDAETCSMSDRPLKKNEKKIIVKKSVIKVEDRLKYMPKLFRWMEKMKNIWSDFKVYETQRKTSNSKYWFSSCVDDNLILDEGLAIRNGTVEGRGILRYNKNSDCYQTNGIERINGSFVAGQLDGMATIHFVNQSLLRAPFRAGVLSGLTRLFSCQYGTCDFSYESWNRPTWLSQVSFYDNGHRIGPAWEFKIGGGVLVGHVDDEGDLSGEELVYTYPDFTTLLVGKFTRSVMISAKQTTLSGIRFDKISKVPYLLFDKKVLSSSKDVYTFDEATKSSLSGQPLLQDPYEKQMVYVAPSTVSGAGMGAYSKRPGKKGMLVGLYSGIKIHSLESQEAKDRRSPYRIDNDWAEAEQIIDIPADYRSVEKYNATLGHILNHSPKPNAWYGMLDHPRFGKIRSIVLLRDVPANEELFCDYGYIETYVKTETSFKTLYNLGKLISNKDDTTFARDIKEHINYIKSKSEELEPYIHLFKNVASFFGKT